MFSWWVWNCVGFVFSFGILLGFHEISCSVHFPCYLQHFEPGSCCFHRICIFFWLRTLLYPLLLHHVGAGSCHVNALDVDIVAPRFSLMFPQCSLNFTWCSLVFLQFWLIFGNTRCATLCKLWIVGVEVCMLTNMPICTCRSVCLQVYLIYLQGLVWGLSSVGLWFILDLFRDYLGLV